MTEETRNAAVSGSPTAQKAVGISAIPGWLLLALGS
jgi:hypothetical protein